MAMCIFNNCNSVQKPFSSLAFFALPKDYRRLKWIENSGNPDLATLSESARRVVCQKHFSPSSLRIQFHRTILSRDAVPQHWTSLNNTIEAHHIVEVGIADDTNSRGDTNSQDNILSTRTESGYEAEPEQQDDNDDWESICDNQTEGDFEVIDVIDNEESSQTIEECAFDNSLTNKIDPPFHRKVDIKTIYSRKRKKVDVPNVTSKVMVEQRSDAPVQNVGKGGQCTASDVIVSSSTSKSDEKASGSIRITNEEDKYFALALVGILERISPQKKAFAKVNILRYLTELEYGVEATIK